MDVDGKYSKVVLSVFHRRHHCGAINGSRDVFLHVWYAICDLQCFKKTS